MGPLEAEAAPGLLEQDIRLAGRTISPSPVFATYWQFAAERQRIYRRRLEGDADPWTTDAVLLRHRFTNAYRAADRVSQYLIRKVIYSGSQEFEEVIFRVLLFKFFNRIDTWNLLCDRLGVLSWQDFDRQSYDAVLGEARDAGIKLYSAAYVVPPPRLGEETKCANHLRLLELMMTSGLPERLSQAANLGDLYASLGRYPSIGRFLAFQFAIDLNYSSNFLFSEMEFVVAGPGARDGIRKCFGRASSGIEEDLIAYVADRQELYFQALGIEFQGLFGRPLQLVDCQNLFCEVDKYARVAHPDVAGVSGRVRIKQRYQMNPDPLAAWFPPGWGINHRIAPKAIAGSGQTLDFGW